MDNICRKLRQYHDDTSLRLGLANDLLRAFLVNAEALEMLYVFVFNQFRDHKASSFYWDCSRLNTDTIPASKRHWAIAQCAQR